MVRTKFLPTAEYTHDVRSTTLLGLAASTASSPASLVAPYTAMGRVASVST